MVASYVRSQIETGREHRELLPGDNVYSLVSLGADVLAFAAPASLTMDRGRAMRIQRDDGGWHATKVWDLPGAPTAVAPERPGRWLVAVPKGIVRFYDTGRVEQIWSERYLGGLYPTSGVGLADGTTFFGMRYFVLRLRPKASTYDVDVLVPPGCSVTRCACLQ